jgi:hypothetical protein
MNQAAVTTGSGVGMPRTRNISECEYLHGGEANVNIDIGVPTDLQAGIECRLVESKAAQQARCPGVVLVLRILAKLNLSRRSQPINGDGQPVVGALGLVRGLTRPPGGPCQLCVQIESPRFHCKACLCKSHSLFISERTWHCMYGVRRFIHTHCVEHVN